MTDPILPPRETLTVEFKSDRAKLPDRELVEAVVCLANAEDAICGLATRIAAR